MAKYYVRVSAACVEDFEIEADSKLEAENEAIGLVDLDNLIFEIDDSYCIDGEKTKHNNYQEISN